MAYARISLLEGAVLQSLIRKILGIFRKETIDCEVTKVCSPCLKPEKKG